MDYSKVKVPVPIIIGASSGNIEHLEYVINFYNPYLEIHLKKKIRGFYGYRISYEDMKQDVLREMIAAILRFDYKRPISIKK